MRLEIIPLLLAAATSVSAELSRTGNVTLFSDTTCENAVFINDWQVGRDFCARVDNSPSGTDSLFRSFVLNARPWCDSGARPTLFVYRDTGCIELIKSYEAGPLYNPSGPDADGTCVAPGEDYQAIAFICDGFEGAVTTTAAAAVQSTKSSSIQGASTRTTEVESTTTTTVQPTKTASAQHDTTQGLTASTISSLSATGIDATSAFSSSGTGTMSSATSTAIVSAGTTWAAPEVAILLGGLLSAIIIVL